MKGKTGIEKGNVEKEGKVTHYNAIGSLGEKDADDTTPEFKKGGAAKKKHKDGGHVKGKAPKHRLDRKPRASGGRSPYTSAHSTESEGNYKDDDAKGEVNGPGAETEIPVYKKGGHVKMKHKG